MSPDDGLTKEQRANFLNEHLKYEIDMLRASHRVLQIPGLDGFSCNSMIEVFCLHARNLLEFFCVDPQSVDPRTFASGYQPLSKKDPATKSIYECICKQTSHLSANRAYNKPKIDAPERRTAFEAIEREISLFKDALNIEWNVSSRPSQS